VPFTLAEGGGTTEYVWADVRQTFITYCTECHGQPARSPALEYFRLDKYDAGDPAPPQNGDLGLYEMGGKVYEKLVQTGTMPPGRAAAAGCGRRRDRRLDPRRRPRRGRRRRRSAPHLHLDRSRWHRRVGASHPRVDSRRRHRPGRGHHLLRCCLRATQLQRHHVRDPGDSELDAAPHRDPWPRRPSGRPPSSGTPNRPAPKPATASAARSPTPPTRPPWSSRGRRSSSDPAGRQA
jgi:hypothetical protein